MTESRKLSVLRDKLIRRRRDIVERFQSAAIEQLNGDDLARVQNEIEAVDKAMAEEKNAEFRL
jgi:phage FluMu protein gp41